MDTVPAIPSASPDSRPARTGAPYPVAVRVDAADGASRRRRRGVLRVQEPVRHEKVTRIKRDPSDPETSSHRIQPYPDDGHGPGDGGDEPMSALYGPDAWASA